MELRILGYNSLNYVLVSGRVDSYNLYTIGYNYIFLSLNLNSTIKGLYNFRAFSLEISLLLVFKGYYNVFTRQSIYYDYALVLEFSINILYNV